MEGAKLYVLFYFAPWDAMQVTKCDCGRNTSGGDAAVLIERRCTGCWALTRN